jgi:hypothetical protein
VPPLLDETWCVSTKSSYTVVAKPQFVASPTRVVPYKVQNAIGAANETRAVLIDRLERDRIDLDHRTKSVGAGGEAHYQTAGAGGRR